MSGIRTKLNSQRGASITFALLLFLVCAVVGSVVLTAGTAAAGRMSKLAEMDQRYYSVTSAARLMRNMVEGESVTIVKTTPTETASANSGDPTTQPSTITLNGRTIVPPVSFETIAQDAAYSYAVLKSGNTRTLTLSVAGHDELKVTVTETLATDGTLTFLITSASGTGEYALKETFTADVSTVLGTNEYLKTTTETTRISWKFADLKTVTEAAQ